MTFLRSGLFSEMFILFSITVPSFFCRLFRLFGWMYKTKVEAGYEKKPLSYAFRQKKTEKQGQELCYSCGATQIDPAKAEPTQSKWCCQITVAACRRRLLEIRSGRPRKPIQNSRCRRAFTLPRLSGDRYAIFTSLTHRFTGRQQTDLLFEPMILQSPQNVNTVCVFAFSMGESTALRLKLSF